MPVCVECGEPLTATIRRENNVNVAAQCPNCAQTADKYVEHNVVHQCLDLLLMRRSVWWHAMYNSSGPAMWHQLLALTFVACVMEAFVVCVCAHHRLPVYRTDLFDAATSETQPLRSLQVVHVIAAGGVPWVDLAQTAAFSVVELVVVGLSLFWGMSAVASETKAADSAGMYHGVVLQGVAKLGYALFLVWDLPLYLLTVIEVASALWMFMAAQAVVGESAPRALFVSSAALTIRLLYRSVTHWCPPSVALLLWDPDRLMMNQPR